MEKIVSSPWVSCLHHYACPTSFSKAIDFGPTAPMVSMAIGENQWLDGRLLYFSSFSSAAAATFPGPWVAWVLYEGAKLSGQVASHTSKWPDFHGPRVTPSDLVNPDGSSMEGMWVDVKADVTQSSMMLVAPLTLSTAKCMSAKFINLSRAMPALVWRTHWRS